jgi:hypothetical protein
MTNKLNYWLFAALISNASASTSSSKGAHDDPPFMIRDLNLPPSITGSDDARQMPRHAEQQLELTQQYPGRVKTN